MTQLREAIALYKDAWRKVRTCARVSTGEVIALCNLGKSTKRASAWPKCTSRIRATTCFLKYWTTELYVRFCAGDEPPSAVELWERAERALKITASSALLALCAWAYTKGKVPDHDMVWHLLRGVHRSTRQRAARPHHAAPVEVDHAEPHRRGVGSVRGLMAATMQLARRLSSGEGMRPRKSGRWWPLIRTARSRRFGVTRAGRRLWRTVDPVGIGVCSLSGDPLVLALSLVGAAAWGHGLLVTRWLEQASQLIHLSRLDEAEQLLLRCLRPPWGSETVRGHAHLRLSTLASHRGSHSEALEQARLAAALFAGEYPPQPQFCSCRATRKCGRFCRWASWPMPATCSPSWVARQAAITCGPLLRHRAVLALAEGQIPFWMSRCGERAQLALDTDHAPPLLGLCSWGFDRLGDEETAQHFRKLCQSAVASNSP